MSLVLHLTSAADNKVIRYDSAQLPYTTSHSGRTCAVFGNQPVDQIPDPKRDVVSPKGFFYRQYNEQMPAGGVQFLDNAWFFGTDNLGAVVVKTDNGLLLFDVLTTWADMQEHMIDQMPAAGLAPADIKYIFIGHRHGDHIGGINLLLQNHTQDAIIVAGEPDAMWIEEQRAAVINGPAPLPSDAGTNLSAEAIKSLRQKQLNELPSRVDIRVPAFEGVKTGTKRIDTGGTEVVAILNPGHTPGQLSAIVPVKQNGKDHRLLVWSGNDKLEEAKQYAISADFARGVAEQEGADVFINTHAYQSASFYHLRRLKEEVEAPNPFVMGADGVSRFLGIFTACQRATKQRFEDGTWFSWE
ncbi:beta-lactamase-like protein [Diaporthe sp. PMI_573]|nr:beta-lactamase-like protein [Diaporthaceae sp. PMI_573]